MLGGYPEPLRVIIHEYLGPETCHILGLPSDTRPAAAALYAARTGWVDALVHLQPVNINPVLIEAAQHDQMAVAQWVLHRGATDKPGALLAAAGRGDIKMMTLFWQTGDLSIKVPRVVASSGNMEAVRWLVRRGNVNLNQIVHGAIQGGDRSFHIMEWAFANGATDGNVSLKKAAMAGNIRALDWLAARGAVDEIYYILHYAAMGGSIPAMEWAVARGARSWNMALYCAAAGGHVAAMEWLAARGADNYPRALHNAISQDRKSVV